MVQSRVQEGVLMWLLVGLAWCCRRLASVAILQVPIVLVGPAKPQNSPCRDRLPWCRCPPRGSRSLFLAPKFPVSMFLPLPSGVLRRCSSVLQRLLWHLHSVECARKVPPGQLWTPCAGGGPFPCLVAQLALLTSVRRICHSVLSF